MAQCFNSIVILVIGTAGYMIIEEWRFLDAVYMTVISVSTVGYREINQVGDIGRVFTIILVASGVGFTLYVAAAVVQFMVEGRMMIRSLQSGRWITFRNLKRY